jgi:Domain of unknown function (DUF4192)
MHGISSPAGLIEGIVPTLGYLQENSLVVAMVEGGALGAVMRVDLDWAVDGVAQLADAGRRGAHAALVAVSTASDDERPAMTRVSRSGAMIAGPRLASLSVSVSSSRFSVVRSWNETHTGE